MSLADELLADLEEGGPGEGLGAIAEEEEEPQEDVAVSMEVEETKGTGTALEDVAKLYSGAKLKDVMDKIDFYKNKNRSQGRLQSLGRKVKKFFDTFPK